MAFSELAIYISFIGMKSKNDYQVLVRYRQAIIIENAKEAREKEIVALFVLLL